jgi:hypothetical protein
MKTANFSLRPQPAQQFKVVGNMVNVLGSYYPFSRPTQFPVSMFITKQSWERKKNSMEAKYVHTEVMPLVNGGTITLFYVKKARA